MASKTSVSEATSFCATPTLFDVDKEVVEIEAEEEEAEEEESKRDSEEEEAAEETS